jgi:hypothetical protein
LGDHMYVVNEQYLVNIKTRKNGEAERVDRDHQYGYCSLCDWLT